MKRLAFVKLLIITSMASSQVNPPDGPIDVPWTVSFGVNIVDNDGFRFENAFNTDNWNFKNPLSFSVQRKWKDHFSAGLALTVNTLEEANLHNNGRLSEDETLFAIDANAKYIYDYLFTNTPRIDPFEAYVLSGFGFTSVSEHDTATFNIGLGFNIWVYRDIGIRLQTMGKFGFSEWVYLKNYIQHSAELIFRF